MFYLNDMILELDDGAKVRKTGDGYMTAMPRVARTGIQLYRGSELGVKDKAIVKIFRDEAEVFNKDSLATFVGKPYTDNHPPKMVDASNWKKFSVGVVGEDVLRDGQFIRVPMALMDAATIKKVDAGKVQLSVGYGCEIDWTPGTTPQGEAYDGKQIGIVVNHVAIVDAARGGKALSIGDDGQETNHLLYTADGEKFTQEPTKDSKPMKTLLVDGITCEMSDTAIEVVKRALDNSKDAFNFEKKKKEEAEEEVKKVKKDSGEQIVKLTTDLSMRDTEIVTLKKQVADAVITPDKLDALVKDRQAVADKAKVLLPAVVVDGKSIDDIMRQVVDSQLGDTAKGWDAAHIKVSFDTLTAKVQAGGGGHVPAYDGVERAGRAFSGQPAATQVQDSEKRYDSYDKKLSESWKNPAGVA
jgi:uncharacterized protein